MSDQKKVQIKAYEDALNFRINALFALLADQFAGIEQLKQAGNLSLLKYDSAVILQQLQQCQHQYQKNYESDKFVTGIKANGQ